MVLKPFTIILQLSMTPYNSVNIFFVYLGDAMLAYIFSILYPLDELTPLLLYAELLFIFMVFVLKSILSQNNYSTLLWFLFR